VDEGPALFLTRHIYNDPISMDVHILRHWRLTPQFMDFFWWGVTVQPITGGLREVRVLCQKWEDHLCVCALSTRTSFLQIQFLLWKQNPRLTFPTFLPRCLHIWLLFDNLFIFLIFLCSKCAVPMIVLWLLGPCVRIL
jgi:hypothetical protein